MNRCELCGRQAADVSTAVVRWLEPVRENEWYGRILRCKDHEACRQRVRDIGDTWPLLNEPRWLASLTARSPACAPQPHESFAQRNSDTQRR